MGARWSKSHGNSRLIEFIKLPFDIRELRDKLPAYMKVGNSLQTGNDAQENRPLSS